MACEVGGRSGDRCDHARPGWSPSPTAASSSIARLLAGQMHGGIVHGLGNAMMEESLATTRRPGKLRPNAHGLCPAARRRRAAFTVERRSPRPHPTTCWASGASASSPTNGGTFSGGPPRQRELLDARRRSACVISGHAADGRAGVARRCGGDKELLARVHKAIGARPIIEPPSSCACLKANKIYRTRLRVPAPTTGARDARTTWLPGENWQYNRSASPRRLAYQPHRRLQAG